MATDRTVPARNAEAITPGDSGSGPGSGEVKYSRGIYVGGAGNLSVEMNGEGSAVVFVGVVAGTLLPIEVTRIYDTSTTATNIVAVW